MKNVALERRVRMAAESILENEALVSGLNDAAAQGLLEWGLACARRVMEATAEMDDRAAEQASYPRLRSLRKMLREVNRWVCGQIGDNAASLDRILQEAANVYGSGYAPPSDFRRAVFLGQSTLWDDDPAQFLAKIRQFVES